jgi:hypothetical protein
MGEFAVEVAGLRSTARSVDDIVAGATVSGAVTHPSEVGDAALAEAIAAFATTMGKSWTTRVSAAEDLAAKLRSSAAAYERADHDARDGVRAAARAF